MNTLLLVKRFCKETFSSDDGEGLLDGDTAAWIASLLVHMGILVLMAAIWQARPPRDVRIAFTSQEALPEEEEEILPQEVQFSNELHDQIGANSLAGIDAAEAKAVELSEVSELTKPEVVDPLIHEDVVQPLDDMTQSPSISSDVSVKGSVGVGTTGAEGAIDRITQEILESLEERPTTVVWMFDQSGSMMAQRKNIAQRFQRIYEELGVLEKSGNEVFQKHGDQPLTSVIVQFGQAVKFLIAEPTANVPKLVSAVDGIQNDETGVETTFSAVAMALKKYGLESQKAPRRNLMFVIATDEIGDDSKLLDDDIRLCRRYAVPIYVIGVPAPFGREEVEVRYADPNPEFDQSEQWVPVKQGPESLMAEAVNISFSAESARDEYERLDSGFGPYALTRLCYETGGVYFTVHPNRRPTRRSVGRNEVAMMSSHLTHFFEPEIMQKYRPDYVSAGEYEKLLRGSKARQALVNAAQFARVNPMSSPRLMFPKLEEGPFKQSLDEAQRGAAKLGPQLDALYSILKEGEKDRAKLTEPRWQAGFDLALGRVLAIKVRTDSYNSMLAKAKNGLKFQDPASDTFVLVPSDEISVGSTMEKLAKQAKELLDRVVRDHPGTPWALQAERELKEPIGWKWSERTLNINRPRMEAPQGNGNPAPPQDTLNRIEKPKPRREVKL